jgi:hypothetical protein
MLRQRVGREKGMNHNGVIGVDLLLRSLFQAMRV